MGPYFSKIGKNWKKKRSKWSMNFLLDQERSRSLSMFDPSNIEAINVRKEIIAQKDGNGGGR